MKVKGREKENTQNMSVLKKRSMDRRTKDERLGIYLDMKNSKKHVTFKKSSFDKE